MQTHLIINTIKLDSIVVTTRILVYRNQRFPAFRDGEFLYPLDSALGKDTLSDVNDGRHSNVAGYAYEPVVAAILFIPLFASTVTTS